MASVDLKTFLKDNHQFFGEIIPVLDTTIIIDADNLLRGLFEHINDERYSDHYKSSIYGGDFVAYGELMRAFFKNLKICNITPVMVFTTSSKDIDEKNLFLEGRWTFKRTHLRLIENFTNKYQKSIPPDNLINIGKNICVDLGIKVVFAPCEAESELVRLSNRYSIPILSNNSDFIFYNLAEGFILLDLFIWKYLSNNEMGRKCIKGTKFNLIKAERSIRGFRRENMVLLRLISGDNQSAGDTYNKILRSVHPQDLCSRWIYHNHHYQRLGNMIDFTLNKTIEENILQLISLESNKNERKPLQRLIRKLSRDFEISNHKGSLIDQLELVYPRNRAEQQASPKHEPATYLTRILETGQLPRDALDFIFKNNLYAYSAFDDKSMASPTLPLFRPYSLALVLLRPISYEGLSNEERKIRIKDDSIGCWDRQGFKYSKFTLTPLRRFPDFGSLDYLDSYSMILLEPATKRRLTMCCFRFKEYDMMLMREALCQVLKEPFLEDASIIFLLIRYIGLENGNSVNPSFVDAVLLLYLFYADYDGCINDEKIGVEAYSEFVRFLEPHAMTNNKFKYPPKPDLYRPILHLINQLSAASHCFIIINSLLAKPFNIINQDRWLNRVLLFRLTRMIQTANPTMRRLCRGLNSALEAAGYVKGLVKLEQW